MIPAGEVEFLQTRLDAIEKLVRGQRPTAASNYDRSFLILPANAREIEARSQAGNLIKRNKVSVVGKRSAGETFQARMRLLSCPKNNRNRIVTFAIVRYGRTSEVGS